MFEQLNPLDRSTAWLEIFILMLGAFLIGYFFARWYYKKISEEKLSKSFADNRKLKAQSEYNKKEQNESDIYDEPGKIKAIKTRERTGVAVENRSVAMQKPKLNFDSIGKASADNKDDLKQMTGIGPIIEKKLNDIGIFTFDQISRFDNEDIETVTELIEFFPGRIERDNWVDQAKELKKS